MTTQAQAEQTQEAQDTTTAAELTPEQQQAVQQEAEASFNAGVSRVRGIEVPKKDEPEQPAAADEPAATTEAAPAPAADADPVVLAGLKESEIKALLVQAGEVKEFREKTEKELRNLFGRFGDIKAQLTTANAGLGKREINAAALKKLNEGYPEIAELLAGDLSALLTATPSAATPGVTQEQIDAHVNKVVADRVADAVEQVNRDLLTRFHSDWEAIRESDDLALWLGTQPAEYRNKFLQSTSATFVSDGLDKFKAWKSQTQESRQQSTRRLETAIAPKGRGAPGAPPVSDHAAFLRGVNRVRGG